MRPHEVRHAARHARSSDLLPRRRNSLSIRSAERRRWAADLTGPGRGGLVVYGMGGIGKSTLAAQIAERVSRLQSGRAINIINGEVSAAQLRRRACRNGLHHPGHATLVSVAPATPVTSPAAGSAGESVLTVE
jgi:Mrp family chromosome partitioning ATPase